MKPSEIARIVIALAIGALFGALTASGHWEVAAPLMALIASPCIVGIGLTALGIFDDSAS